MQTKKKTTLIALFLIFSMAAIAVMPDLQSANGTVYYYSYIYCTVSNSIIGRGQTQLIVTWTAEMPPDIGETATAQGRAAWYDLTVTVTDPNGVNTTLTIDKTDPIGGGYVTYTPELVGVYKVQVYMPKQIKPNAATDMFNPSFRTEADYSEATSPVVEFTVQEAPIPEWNESPLPDGYWSRPINQASRKWYILGGNWLGGAHEQPAGAAGGTTSRWVEGLGPESAHILWAKPRYVGGYMEGRWEVGYQTGHYQGLDFTAIVINGKMYYPYRDTAHSNQGYLCVDLYTGETLAYINDTMPTFGQIYDYESPNQHGGFAYLWEAPQPAGMFGSAGVPVTLPPTVTVPRAQLFPNGSVIQMGAPVTIPSSQVTNGPGTALWQILDASTLQTVCYIANISYSGTAVYGKDGSILRYNLANLGTTFNPNYYLQIWNSSAGTMPSSQDGTGYWQWRPMGGTFGGSNAYLGGVAYNYVHDGRNFFTLNVSIPYSLLLGPRNSIVNQTATIQCIREGQNIILATSGQNTEAGLVQGRVVSLSLERGKEGTVIYDKPFTPPFASAARNETSSGFFGAGLSITGIYPDDGMICFQNSKTLRRYGISIDTGQQVWMSEPEPQGNYYTMISNYYNYNNKSMLLTGGYGGVILAYDIKTGEILWNFTASNIGDESPYGNYPINIFAIADGKIYTLTGEHSISQPMWRGYNIRCINASDGTEIWNLMGFGANGGAHLTGQYMQMADGKVIGLNYFDNRIYCIGKGNSRTTVSAPQIVPAQGSSVMLTGTVTDDTPVGGSRNANDQIDFVLKGTPAISDADMGRWMEYLFMDQAKPNATGVPVSLDTIDPNGNFIHIGDVTSDMYGNYGLPYAPDVPGTYQIIATFAGSKSYGSSIATTYLSIGEPTPTAVAPTPPPASTADTYLLPSTIGIIVAIAVATVVIVMALRKRP